MKLRYFTQWIYVILRAQVYPNFKLMVVGIHGIGKSTLLEALRKDGTGSYQQAGYQATFSERRVNEKGL